ncbi:MAG: hypothetical protein WC437_02605 [Patescibacteria group bacterium]|jgi:hypothetical protein|nr:hypothetical protein [Patescibacteria group bacterium]
MKVFSTLTRNLFYVILVFFINPKIAFGAVDGLSGVFTSTDPLTGFGAFGTLTVLFSICAMIMMVIGGIMLFFSNGDPSRASKGKDIIIGTLVGVVVWILSYFILTAISG